MSEQDMTYRELLESHLGALTTYGVHYLDALTAAIDLLEQAINGDVILTAEERDYTFGILKELTAKYRDLIETSLRARQNFNAD